jgi:hypothetical protein
MLKLINKYLIRNIGFDDLLEHFLVSAVVGFLGVRLYLRLFNYPILGGHNFHIAHMLWGGLLMLAAIFLLLIFLNHQIKQVAAIVGGLGFGLFIDELGKFITRDNNYFYQPTVAFIYIIFILLYLLYKLLDHYSNFTPQEYLVNSIEYLKDAVINDLDTDEKKQAAMFLKQANQNNDLTVGLNLLFKHIDTIKPGKPRIFSVYWNKFKNFYQDLAGKSWFGNGINVFFIGKSVVAFVNALIFTAGITTGQERLRFSELMHIFATSSAALFVLVGVWNIKKNRLYAYQMFKRSLLVTIFLSQVFAFYEEQLSAFFILMFNVVLLVTLNLMIDLEKEKNA